MWVKGQIIHTLEDATGGVKDLLTRETQPRLFDRLRWFELLWAHNRIGANPIIARTWSSGARCWLFLAQQSTSKATALGNYYTLSFRPIYTGDPDLTTRKALLIAMARRLRGHFGQIALSPVPHADGTADELSAAFRRAGWIVFQSPKTANWTADVAGKTFDAYWAERPGALRSTFARKLKKSSITTEVHCAVTDALWAEYESIYAESWKGEEGSLAFLRAMAEEEAAAGCLRLGIARLDGVAVAAQLWTLEPDRAIIHKLAYRQTAAVHSPGTILTHAMFRYVIDTDKVALIDYGTGDDGYKADWMDTRTMLDQIECYNPRNLRALLQAAKKGLIRLARGNRHA
jgi:hypothetical protein